MNVSVPFVDYRSTSVRPGWAELPGAVRATVTGRIGEVVSVAVAGGGFTPAFAATVTTADGHRYFVKAADLATEFGQANQREAAVLAALPPGLPVPAVHWSADATGWAILCLEALQGHMPGQPWTDTDLCAVLAAYAETAEALAFPSPMLRQAVNQRSFADHCQMYLDIWRGVRDHAIAMPPDAPEWAVTHLRELARLEELVFAATAEAAGVMHFDLRADNVIITGEQAVIFDWNWARPGPPAADTIMLLQTAYGEHDVDALLHVHPTTAGLDDDVVDAILAALGGFMIVAGRRDPVPTSPWLRVHQRAQGVRALAWLADRRGWARP